MSTRNRLLAIIAALLVVVLVVAGALFLNRPDETAANQAESADDKTASQTASEPVTTSEPEQSTDVEPSENNDSGDATESTPSSERTDDSAKAAAPSPTSAESAAAGYECTTATEGFEPVRYTFEGSLDVDETVISVGEDEDGNIGAPPPAEKRTAAWWENGPKPGPTEGKTVLSIHTYRNGGALGNEMYDGGVSHLQAGDVIKLYSADGKVACYEYTDAQRVMVADYDPDSDLMVDFEGDPEVVIIICWDFDPNADEDAGEDPWDSRVFFNGSLF